ncbi:four helix bundle protein [Candidatus Gottesmanbacteria bacterium]|nr:four helix bundle protein [Candidatus Gottesmanbacteria bacterium]
MNAVISKPYNLEERTVSFAERIVQLCKKSPKNYITAPIIDQLIRAGTSIGANYSEATGASSKRDFINKVFVCKKEAIETKYWLRLLSKAEEKMAQDCRVLWREAQELTLIFSKIAGKSRK